MKNNLKTFIGAAALMAAFSASAVQRDITVTADIDSTVDVTLADGSALPASIAMQYLPGKGLDSHKQNIKFWSNAVNKDLNVSLASSPSLTDGNGGNAIPLSVSVNGTALTTTAAVLTYASLFPTGITNGSAIVPLVISQANQQAAITSGKYSGVVSLVVTQATGTSSP